MLRVTFICVFFLLTSCGEKPLPIPKPRLYPKVVYPEKSYKNFSQQDCPFSMEIPIYFEYVEDTKKTEKEKNFPCWFDLYCKDLNTYLHFSYLPFDNRTEFEDLISDAFEMVEKHNVKASSRRELLIDNTENKVHGLVFEIDGPVATPLQFFMTDSTEHFIRGSLYFKASVDRDSIAPVYDFLKVDVQKLIEGFKWE